MASQFFRYVSAIYPEGLQVELQRSAADGQTVIYAEGQRRYVETFSPYVRQFFDRLLAEADRLQRLISSYLAQVHAELDEVQQVRRAAAYTRGAGTI